MILNHSKLQRCCGLMLVLLIVVAALVYAIGGEQFHYENRQTTMLTPTTPVGEITGDTVLTQALSVPGDTLLSVTLRAATYARDNTGTLLLELLDGEGNLLHTQAVDVSQLQDNANFTFTLPQPLPVPGSGIVLRITAPDSQPGNAVTLYAGNSISATRAEVSADLDDADVLYLNGQPQTVALCTQVSARSDLWFGDVYGYLAAGVVVLAALFCLYLLHCNKVGKPFWVLLILSSLNRYHFLMEQLVARDFKTKYRRSVLGVIWSFLNPLLTMLVQYVVFSTLFKSDIPNFALYLLSGIVTYSFFSEATNMTLSSIVSNSSLITKVYVPKYIYPLTRVIRCLHAGEKGSVDGAGQPPPGRWLGCVLLPSFGKGRLPGAVDPLGEADGEKSPAYLSQAPLSRSPAVVLFPLRPLLQSQFLRARSGLCSQGTAFPGLSPGSGCKDGR